MKRGIVFWIWGISLAYLIYQAAAGYSALPERVASHFAMDGTPNGWMSRTMCYGIFIGVALVTNIWPLLGRWMVTAAPGFLNLPNKAYWLETSERTTRLADVTENHLAGTMALTNLLLTFAFQVIYQYNTTQQLPVLWPIWTVVVATVVFGLWYPRSALKVPKSSH